MKNTTFARRATALLASLLALLALAVALALAAPARAAELDDYDDPDADNAILSDDDGVFQTLGIPESDYEGGTIPILRLTFSDGVDPETGEWITADEMIERMNTSANHTFKAPGVTCDIEVPATYDNPEDDMWDGVSGYTGESGLTLEFVRGRGNSTWRQAKKPYKLKFDSKVNLFGMGKNKHWALIANYYDLSLSIDRMVGWLGDQLSFDFTPRGVPVDLFINGTYYGSYLLMEEVRVDSNRVEIDTVSPDAGDLGSLEITGDYLLGYSRKPSAMNWEYFQSSRGHAFTYDTPEYGYDLTAAEAAQEQYLRQHIDRVEDTIYAKGFVSEAGDYVWDLIDKLTLADYWWVQEFTTNRDAFATPSTYFYKLADTVAADGTTVAGKIYWGPLWDFDFVWGQLFEEGFENAEAEWVWLLRQDPEFVALLKERWAVIDAALEEITREGGLLDGYIAEMTESWNANRALWPTEDNYGWDYSSCEAAINSLRSHMEARRAWINAHLDELQTSYCHVTFMDGDTVVGTRVVKAGNILWEGAPEAPEKEGMIFLGWYCEDGSKFVAEDPVWEDELIYAAYVSYEDATKADTIYFAQDEVWTRRGTSILYELYPEDAQDQRIAWSSSDESVLRVENGYIIPTDPVYGEDGTAEAIVTARLLGSGTEASIRVVLYRDIGFLSEPESITFDEAATVAPGERTQLHYTTEPSPSTLNEDFDLVFYSEDESVATVSDLGVVTGVAEGTTQVTVWRMNRETYEDELVATIAIVVASTEPVDPEPVDPEPVDPEPVDPEPVDPEPVDPEPQPSGDGTKPDQNQGSDTQNKTGGDNGGSASKATKNEKLPNSGEAALPIAALAVAGAVFCAAGAFARRRTRDE